MNIVFLISHIPNPRFNKRIALLKENNEVSLICWDRGSRDLWDIVHKDINNVVIRQSANYGDPLKRIIPTIKFAFRAIKELRGICPECLYTANVDMLTICSIYIWFQRKKTKIIYEIGDLNKLIIDKPRGILKKIIRNITIILEKKLCQKINLLVLTSEKFFEIYYSRFLPAEKMMFIPNMPNPVVFSDYEKDVHEHFTVGFIGSVRYEAQMKMLIDAAERCNVKVLFAGASIDDEIERLCSSKPFIKYLGKFNFDTEIATLYAKCDCVFSVYDADLNNVKVALPNKLYEAIYCGLPIIVARDTYLAELVENLGVGVAVCHSDATELEQVLKKMSEDKAYYGTFVEACHAHKDEINIDIYNKRLIDRIKTLV